MITTISLVNIPHQKELQFSPCDENFYDLLLLLLLLLLLAPAAAAAQSCPTLCDPIDSSPPGSPVPRILQARTLEWVVISFSNV